VPNDFHEILKIYTANGYRVIALAGKNLPSEVTWHASTKLPRDQVESDLDFYGLLIMQNAMKPETTKIISELAQADLTTLMVTGDNLLTALCVARKCGMVPKWNKVIIVEAHAEQEPEDLDGDGLLIARTNKVPPRIEWKLADETVDLDNLDLNAIHQHANHPVSLIIVTSYDSFSYNRIESNLESYFYYCFSNC
jgi:magnesium-transporting ATPase (P-type)